MLLAKDNYRRTGMTGPLEKNDLQNTLFTLVENGGSITLPVSEVENFFTSAFLDLNLNKGLITINRKDTQGINIIIALTAKGREYMKISRKVSFFNRVVAFLFRQRKKA